MRRRAAVDGSAARPDEPTMPMRALLTGTAAAAAVAVPVALAGQESPEPPLRLAQGAEPRHQLLGDWRLRSLARFSFRERNSTVYGRAAHPFRVGRCRVRRGAAVFRGYSFAGSDGTADVWRGRVVLPGRRCRRRAVASTIAVTSDLRLTESSLRRGREVTRVLTRIRPRPSEDDPVLGTWERNRVGVVIRLVDRGYAGRAREAFVIANGCTLPAGEAIWRLRPSAPDRYDGIAWSYQPPPGCRRAEPTPSRWRLDRERGLLIRETADGESVEYARR